MSETAIAALLQPEFGVTRRQVRAYLAIVKRRLAEALRVGKRDPFEDRARIEGMLLRAYRAAEGGNPKRGPDASGMVQAARALGQLLGLIGSPGVRVESDGAGKISVYVPERDPE